MGTPFSKIRKKALSVIANPRTAPEHKKMLESEILGYCKGCAEDKKKVNATHDRFGTPLCDKCNAVVQQKIDIIIEQEKCSVRAAVIDGDNEDEE